VLDSRPLFEPFRVGGLRLPNRIVMAPMTRAFSPNGIPGENVAAYYAKHAAPGYPKNTLPMTARCPASSATMLWRVGRMSYRG
jgi:2,4-dienoyl-CoA reductase-like NADH-dependent reductase (Old Yellow Enzyme family)